MDLEILLSFSLIPISVLAAFKLHIVDKRNLPILILFIVGGLAEASILWIDNSIFYQHKSNIYLLIEFVLFSIQLRNWGLVIKKEQFYLLQVSIVLLWLITSFLVHPVPEYNATFRLIYSFILAILSINLCTVLMQSDLLLWKDYRFLICFAALVFFIYNFILVTYFVVKINLSGEVYEIISIIRSTMNATVNLFYLIALLCIPKKHRYLLQ